MKHILLSHNLILILLVVLFCFHFNGKVTAQGIRIVPGKLYVKKDSLHVNLTMYLDGISVGSGTAFFFTPVMSGKKKQSLSLPAVIISGKRRARNDRREAFLSPLSPDRNEPQPFRQIIAGRNYPNAPINYQIAVPYASWMQQAALLLQQEYKECCGKELLALDTLKRSLSISSVPPTARENEFQAKPQSRPVQEESIQNTSGGNTTVYTYKNIPATGKPAAPVVLSIADVDQYAVMVSFLPSEGGMGNKHRTEGAVLYFDYPLGKDDIYPDYKNNREEINKVEKILAPLTDNRFSTLARLRIRGYSSPDGPYGDNERLAKARSGLFARYLRDAYNIPRSSIEVSSEAEDWEGFIDLLREYRPPYTDAALDIIRRYGIFNGREKHLMDLQGGAPYKDMLRRFFPKLRRIEVVVQYDVREVNGAEASELIYTHPDLLSLDEMYAVARYYRPGSDQYREVYEVAAYHFPNDVVANVNAASAVMLTGDLISAWNYLSKVEADPRAWNNIGVLNLMEGNPEGAAIWFRKAVGVEPRKARANLQLVERMIK
jgi:hypothetical protein